MLANAGESDLLPAVHLGGNHTPGGVGDEFESIVHALRKVAPASRRLSRGRPALAFTSCPDPGLCELPAAAIPSAARVPPALSARCTTGGSIIFEPSETTPSPRCCASSNAATIFRAFSISACEGANAWWITGICSGCMQPMPSNPRARADSAQRREALHVADVAVHRVARLYARGVRGVHQARARVDRFAALRGLHHPEVGGVILQANAHGDHALAGAGDGQRVLDPQGRFQDGHQPDRSVEFAARRDLCDSRFHRQHLLRVLDLGDEHQVGRFRDDLFQILVAERELVDAHHALSGAEIHRAQGIAHQDAGRVLFRGMDRVFEVEDDGVGCVQSGVDEIFWLAAGKVEPRAAQAVASRRRRQRNGLRKRAAALSQPCAPDRRLDAGSDHERQRAFILNGDAGVMDAEFRQHILRLSADAVAIIRSDARLEFDLDAAGVARLEDDPQVGADVGTGSGQLRSGF